MHMSHISTAALAHLASSPKKAKPGKWRLIVNLSSPANASVNHGINRDMCSISYISIDQITDSILCLGRGALMAKVDIKQAYRIVPVHPDDRCLLAHGHDGEIRYGSTQNSPVQPSLRPPNFYGNRRCPAVDHGEEWS